MSKFELEDKLQKFYSDEGLERGGYIDADENIIECENNHPNPLDNFDMSYEALEEMEGVAVATWHTHPNGSKNLSREDYSAFQNWAHLKHYIVGKDGVFCYSVDEESGAVIIEE